VIKQILDSVAGSNSRIHKETVLANYASDVTLRAVVKLALDPFVNFYIRKIPEYQTVANDRVSLKQALVRLELLSSRTLTGNAGIEHLRLILSKLSADDAQVVERIIAKDLRCGVSDATANKIWPGLIPEYPCMLASAYDQRLVDRVVWPAIAQLKMDGMRFNAIVQNGKVEFRSRNGKAINIPDPSIEAPFRHMAEFYGIDMVFDGELVVVDEAGKILDRKTGNGILNKAVKGTMSVAEAVMVRATLWDAITLNAFQAGVEREAYKHRLGKLCNCISDLKNTRAHVGHYVDLVHSQQVQTQAEAEKVFQQFLSDGQEGIILKTRDGIWENKRSKGLIKFKGELECDLRVVDWEEGTGKNRGRLGALVLESGCGTIRVNVGTGFSDTNRDNFTAANSIGRIVAIKYNARIADKNSDTQSLFLPVFVEFRDDKSVADTDKDIK
jgi:ATP-dependent DNA ligase